MDREQYVKEHFPEVECGARPVGAQILVQLRSVKKKVGSILLVEETRDFNSGNTKVARLIKVGHIAFRNRETGERWREGAWANIGDVIVIPAYGGFRFEIPVPGTEDRAIFCLFNDFDVKLVVESNFEAFDTIL